MEQKPEKKSSLPATALWIDFAAAACIGIGICCFYSFGLFFMLGILLILAGLIFPFVAIVCAICALCLGKKEIGRRGVAESIIAILIPVVTVIVLIILFSTGVAYISFM